MGKSERKRIRKEIKSNIKSILFLPNSKQVEKLAKNQLGLIDLFDSFEQRIEKLENKS